jgi:hypothetical protein
MVAGVYSEDPAAQLEATMQFRKLLSIGAPTATRAAPARPPFRAAAPPRRARELLTRPLVPLPRAAERSPPIEEVIKTGVVPRFVQFLQRGDIPQLQARAPSACAASARLRARRACAPARAGARAPPRAARPPSFSPPCCFVLDGGPFLPPGCR